MSRLIDVAEYKGIAVEKELVIDAGERYKQLLDDVRNKLNKEHSDIFLGSIFDSKVQDEAKDWIGVYVRDWIKKHGMIDKYSTIEALIDAISYDILDISILKPLVNKRGVTDIFVDDYNYIYYDNFYEGRKPYEEKFKSDEEMLFIMKKIAAAAGKNLSAEEPAVNAQIGNNRFNVTLSKEKKGIGGKHYISIRVHRDGEITKKEIIASGMITKEGKEFIEDVSRSKYISGMVAGATGTGKTTTLDSLILSSIETWERQIIIQDEDELRAKFKRPQQNIVELYTKKSPRKETEYTIARLIEEIALRNKPDRIIVCEIRLGPDGAMLLYAFETGHLGWTTIHAGSAKKTPKRLAKMIRTTRPNASDAEILDDIYGLLDIVIFIKLIRINGIEKRRITEIAEFTQDDDGKNGIRYIFKYNNKKDALERVGTISEELTEKLQDAGIDPTRWVAV